MAVQTDIGVRVGADIGPLQKDLKKAGNLLTDFGKNARTRLNSIAAATAAGMAAATAAVVALGIRSAASASDLQNLAKVANTSTEVFQRMAFGAKTAGIEQDKLADILKNVQSKVGSFLASGGGPMAKFFDDIAPKVGVTAEQFRNLSGPEALQLYVNSLESANISQAEMTYYMEAMSSGANKLLPLLRDNGKELAELGKQADALGIVLSDVEVTQLAQMGSDIDTLTTAFSGLTDKMAAQFAPIISRLVQDLQTASIESGIFEDGVTKAFNNIISAAGFVLDAIEGIKRAFRIAADAIIIGGSAIASTYLALLKPVRVVLQGIVSAVEAITPSTDEAIKNLEGLASGVGRSAKAAKIRLKELREEIAQGVDTRPGISALKDFLGSMDEFADQSGAVIGEAWANIKTTLDEPLPSESLKQYVKDAQDAAAQVSQALATATQPGAQQPQPWNFTAEDMLKLPIVQDEDRLARLQESFKTEQELLREQNELRLGEIQYFKDLELITEAQGDEMRLRQAQQYADAMAAIDERRNRVIVTSTQDMFNQLSAVTSTRSRKLFEIGKAASIAQALIQGSEAVVSSYAHGSRIGGPPVGAAFAAVAATTTAAMIQNIRAQQFGSAGGSSVAPGGGSSAATAAASAGTTTTSAPLEVRMTGLDSGAMFSGEMISTMFDKLREEAGDRGVRFVT